MSMSQELVLEIIERASKDEAFRKLLFTEPQKALEGYELTDAERKSLENLNEDNFDDFAGGLGDRTTKGMWRPAG
jgi:hypothetical protein